jgi:hypothetical protein
METAAGSGLPEKFHSEASTVFPLYHVLADVGAYAGGQVLEVDSSDPLRAVALAIRKEGNLRVLIANLTNVSQKVALHLPFDGKVLARYIDETNAAEAMRNPEAYRQDSGQVLDASGGLLERTLLPYVVMRIDAQREKT